MNGLQLNIDQEKIKWPARTNWVYSTSLKDKDCMASLKLNILFFLFHEWQLFMKYSAHPEKKIVEDYFFVV